MFLQLNILINRLTQISLSKCYLKSCQMYRVCIVLSLLAIDVPKQSFQVGVRYKDFEKTMFCDEVCC